MSSTRLTPQNAVAALIELPDGQYLAQRRSNLEGIWYPAHWGLFGGGVEEGETAEVALHREIMEELGVEVADQAYFTEFTFDFTYQGFGVVWRRYFFVELETSDLAKMTLGEGDQVAAWKPTELLAQRMAPYDAFALWMHVEHRRRG